MDEREWIEANAERAAEALARPEVTEEVYHTLGGQPDPKREREVLAAELARLRLTWKTKT
jgi:hypothetical protein